MVDAGSTDGTVSAVRGEWPNVTIHESGPDVFWGTGMRVADEHSSGTLRDFDLWLNDDVVLSIDAIQRMLWCADVSPNSIIVGQLLDEVGRPSYGGFRRAGRPLSLMPVGMRDHDTLCDTFNGNVVLVPAKVREAVGTIDSALPHAMGDIDYGFRARRMGISIVQPAGALGVCNKNEPSSEGDASALSRLRRVRSVKNLPPKAWWTLCRRHTGPWAPVYFLKPYAEALVRSR